jgi:hypothetical protein
MGTYLPTPESDKKEDSSKMLKGNWSKGECDDDSSPLADEIVENYWNTKETEETRNNTISELKKQAQITSVNETIPLVELAT